MTRKASTKRDIQWYRYQRVDGKLGRWVQGFGPPYTELYECNGCGRLGNSLQVFLRYDCFVYDWWDLWQHGHPILCWKCRNKFYPAVKKYYQIKELNLLIGRLKRARAIWQQQ